MTVDPRVGFWFSIVMAIVSALGVCGTQFTTLFGEVVSNKILAAIVILNVINGAINAILHMIPSKPGSANEFALGPKAIPAIILGLIVASFMFPGSAFAQVKLVKPTGNIAADIAAATGRPPATSSDPIANIIGALDAKLLPDLQYSKAMADASGSKVTAPCFGAWIDLINVRQKSVTGADGQPMPFPDPGVISRFEQIVELRNALQPDSNFMIACSPVASMVKKDIVGFIGIVISGGAGLATLVPGL